MTIEDIANLATAVALIATGLFPIFTSIKLQKVPIPALKSGFRKLQISSSLLGSFLLIHGFYHLSEYAGNDFLSDDILEPSSILLLSIFAVYVWKMLYIPSSPASRSPSAKPSIPKKIVPIILFFPLITSSAIISDFTGNPAETVSLTGILFATALFIWMALRNPSVKSLHFQFASITIIWSVAEVPHVLNTIGIISAGTLEGPALWIHFVSMLLIGIFVSSRSVQLALRSSKNLKVKGKKPIKGPAIAKGQTLRTRS